MNICWIQPRSWMTPFLVTSFIGLSSRDSEVENALRTSQMATKFEYQLGLAQRTIDKPLQEMIIFGLGEKKQNTTTLCKLNILTTLTTLCLDDTDSL